MKNKKLRNDIILIVTLLLVSVIILIIFATTRPKNNLSAKILLKNEVIREIDLSKDIDEEFVIDGIKGKMNVHFHNHGIEVTSSSCPNKDCIRTGFVSTANKPIICAYNQVYIVIEGSKTNYDVEI